MTQRDGLWTKWTKKIFSLLGAACCLAIAAPIARAHSLPDTAEAINKARITSRVLFITAHPDDEWSRRPRLYLPGENADVRASYTLTRGQGGQNARSAPARRRARRDPRHPELLRRKEDATASGNISRARSDSVFETRPDDEDLGDVMLEDMVRVIRTYRPNVSVINESGQEVPQRPRASSGPAASSHSESS